MSQMGGSPTRVAPPPSPADIGLVAALPIEVEPLLDRFERVRKYKGPRHKIIEGRLGGKVVALILTGPGRQAARRGTELLIAGHRPAWIVSVGFAGALDPILKRNEIVLPNVVIDEAGACYTIDVSVPPDAPGYRAGTLLTVDRIILTAAEKTALRARHGADIVDMETAAVAALCSEQNRRFLAVRVVSDEAGTDLPREVLSLLGPTGSFRLGAAVGALWRRPSSLKDLWALREQALQSADRLADVLPAALARLP